MSFERIRLGSRVGVGLWTGVAIVAFAWGTGAASAGSADVVPVRSGDVVVLDADTRQRELESGGSGTEFAIEASDAAACPGDSEHDSWRVQTFLVPASVDPGTIPYGADWPRLDEHMYSLYDTITQPVIDSLTVPNASAGSPGTIDALAPMSFAVFPVGELPPGRYRIGIACTLLYQTANYWDTEIVIESSPQDRPSQIVWRLATASSTDDQVADSSSLLLWLGVAAAAIAVVVGIAVVRRRRSSFPSSTSSKELQ